MLNKKLGYIAVILIFFLFIFALFHQTHVPTKIFENKFVKFSMPDDIVVVDMSNDSCEINFFNDTPITGDRLDPNFIADLRNVNLDYISNMTNITDITIVNGINATEFVDKSNNTFNLFIPLKNRNSALLFEIYLTETESTYETIKNSLLIK